MNLLGNKRGRPGRPTKYDERKENDAEQYFIKFLKDEKRKRENSETIKKDDIEKNLDEIFVDLEKIVNEKKGDFYQEFLYLDNKKESKESKYEIKKLILENWEPELKKEEQLAGQEPLTLEKREDDIFPLNERYCYKVKSKNGKKSEKLEGKYNLDQSFFLFLKHISNKVKDDYFFLVLRFIIFLREYINSKKKNSIDENKKSKNRNFYSQIYNAEIVSEICNDFFMTFLELFGLFEYFKLDTKFSNDYTNINKEKDEEKKEEIKKEKKKEQEKERIKNELIELTRYFSYWLYKEKHVDSHLILNEDTGKKKSKL